MICFILRFKILTPISLKEGIDSPRANWKWVTKLIKKLNLHHFCFCSVLLTSAISEQKTEIYRGFIRKVDGEFAGDSKQIPFDIGKRAKQLQSLPLVPYKNFSTTLGAEPLRGQKFSCRSLGVLKSTFNLTQCLPWFLALSFIGETDCCCKERTKKRSGSFYTRTMFL